MHKKIPFILFFALLFSNPILTHSQDESPWESYLRPMEKGVMDVTVNMKYSYGRPNYKNLLVVGTYTPKCHKNGYPTEEGLEKLYTFSDSIANIVDGLSKNRLAGVLTYQCNGFDIFYVKDTVGLRESINHFIERDYPNSKNYLTIRQDKKWAYYTENLYPKDDTFGFFENHDFLRELFYQGDDLSQKRRVRHWVQFKKPKRRQQFIEKIAPLEFRVDSLLFNKKNTYPYELQISREDKVDPETISKFNALLNKVALMFYGAYDGWSTDPVLKD